MSHRVKPTGRIILIALVAALLAGATGLYLEGSGRDGFLAASRFTARWSFVWFLAAWSASSLARLWPGGWRGTLLYNRRGVGLGFAAAHLIHATFFLTAIWMLGARSSIATVFGGGLGYVFVLAMALTSHDYWVRTLTPRRWKLLHATGGVYIAFIFAFTYFGRLARDPVLAIAGMSLLGTVVAFRLAAWVRPRPQPLA